MLSLRVLSGGPILESLIPQQTNPSIFVTRLHPLVLVLVHDPGLDLVEPASLFIWPLGSSGEGHIARRQIHLVNSFLPIRVFPIRSATSNKRSPRTMLTGRQVLIMVGKCKFASKSECIYRSTFRSTRNSLKTYPHRCSIYLHHMSLLATCSEVYTTGLRKVIIRRPLRSN